MISSSAAPTPAKVRLTLSSFSSIAGNRAYFAKINTDYNVTVTISDSYEAYNGTCAGLVYDPVYSQIIVAFSVDTNKYKDITMDYTEDLRSPYSSNLL